MGIKQRGKPFSRDAAEAIAAAGLAFLAEDRGRIARFLADTGLTPDELATAGARPDLLGAVLDYIVGDESLLLVFADHAALDPAIIEPARLALSGTFE